jgi:vacuolar-type H+-ATPase subunit H
MPDVEPEVVKQWREKQKELIAERDAESEEKKHEIVQKAREAIDQFYEDYNDKKQKAIEQNRYVHMLLNGHLRTVYSPIPE